ncbi:MAG TPA: PDZ domain-containing protein [Candidatus Tumulicola sp.]|nr:PDZ domain-containing protein [Candidatus Tumulicola sp.]
MKGRIVVVTILALLELAGLITTLATFESPASEFGYNVGSDGVTVASVEPGLPAQRAGLRPGDRLVYQSVPRFARLNTILNEPVSSGDTLRLRVERAGKVYAIAITPVPFPSLYGISDLFYAFAGVALGAVSLALVVLRPSRLTWGFALVAPPLLVPEALVRWAHHAPSGPAFACEIGIALAYALQASGMMIFASRFPDDAPRGPNRVVDRLAAPLGLAIGLLYVYTYFNIWFSPTPPPVALLYLQDYVAPSLPSLFALFALVTTYAVSSGSLRSRLTPTLVAFVLLVLTSTAQQVAETLTSNAGALLFVYFAFALAAVLVAVSVAYAVVRHRVIDVSFIVGRTLVYTILTLFAVSIFSMIEYFVGKLLERGGLALVLEIVAAAAIGLSMNALHARLDRAIDVVLFRRRHLAEARIKRTAAMLPHAMNKDFVNRALVHEAIESFDLASAAAFVLDDDAGGYARACAAGWGSADAAALDLDDRLVVHLRATRAPVHLTQLPWERTDVPSGAQQPLYAIPVTLGTRVEAIALYGGHTAGEDLDPDERHSLRGLANGAALAYDHLAAADLRRRLEAARQENESLRRVERTLTQLLERRLDGEGAPPPAARPIDAGSP